MLSRVAHNLYWLGRYLERADSAARLADVDYQASRERGVAGAGTIWDGLIAALDAEAAYEQAHADDPDLTPADFFMLSPQNPGSIRSTVAAARQLARGLREHISRETWEEINELHLELGGQQHIVEHQLHDTCDAIVRHVQTVFGLYDNTALHDEGREWFRCGIFMERADMTSRILDAKYHILLGSPAEIGGPLDSFQWMGILRAASAWEAYHKIGRHEVDARDVAALLLFTRSFPRSVAFSVMALQRHFDGATAASIPAGTVAARRALAVLDLDLAAGNIDDVIAQGLHEWIDELQARLIAIDNAIEHAIFAAAPVREGIAQRQAQATEA